MSHQTPEQKALQFATLHHVMGPAGAHHADFILIENINKKKKLGQCHLSRLRFMNFMYDFMGLSDKLSHF